jgi:hypothetical protein
MNKKGLSTIIALLIMILLTLMAVAIIWIVIDNLISSEFPQYKITKKVCYQEKITDKLIFPEDFNLTNCPKNISGTCYKDIYVGEYFLAVENIDEYVSVISYKLTNFTENNYSIKIKGDIYKTICNQEEVEDNIIYWCYDEEDCGSIQIGDKHETWGIDWLKENCECSILCSPNYEGNLACIKGICVQFQCGEYQVEVL